MLRKVFVAVFIFSTLCVLGYAQTQNVRPKGILDYKKELALTDKQVNTIDDAIKGFEAKAKEIEKKMQTLSQEINSLLASSGNMETIKKKIKELYLLRADLDIANIEAARKINSVLTPEQRKKWQEIRQRELNRSINR
ncbi:MAG: Spy/CpxP family protein refolding chaperone [candidate division WOR-3 bacterium]